MARENGRLTRKMTEWLEKWLISGENGRKPEENGRLTEEMV